MNSQIEAAVTKALDAAIVSAADEYITRLSTGLDQHAIAHNIRLALRSLKGLQDGIMPDYNPWVALFYSLWYQAGHINLAYTLTQLIPFEDNPLSDSSDRLKVVDFGCGELAMQFGLALAATDALEKHRRVPQITVFSEDGSDPMRRLDGIYGIISLKILSSILNSVHYEKFAARWSSFLAATQTQHVG